MPIPRLRNNLTKQSLSAVWPQIATKPTDSVGSFMAGRMNYANFGFILATVLIFGNFRLRAFTSDKELMPRVVKETRLSCIKGLNGKSVANIFWQCSCDDGFANAYSTLTNSTDHRYKKPQDESLVSRAYLEKLSYRMGITLHPYSPDGYKDWVRPGPVQKFNGPLPYVGYGYDPVCSSNDVFKSKGSWFRDSLKSEQCNTMPRERALGFALANLLPRFNNASAIHESSPNPFGISKVLKQMFGPEKYISSQYSPSIPCGQKVGNSNGDISIDLEDQHCFPTNSFDIVVTQDVFEHIYDAEKAFKEIARTLKPGGFHIFTVPITAKQFGTFKTAERVEGVSTGKRGITVKLHTAPEIHGNPMGAGGALLTRQWGYDIVSYIKNSSDLSTYVVFVDSKELGIHHAEYRDILVSRKDGENDALTDVWAIFDGTTCFTKMITCKTWKLE